jgi:hypothetical protein
MLLFAGCSARVEPRSRTVVLDYHELGPQVLIHELVGYEWYQWNNHGGSDPKSFDDVKVVVFRDIGLDEVMRMHPVEKEQLADYRYLEYQKAIDFLSEHEREPDLKDLENTRKKIIESLGS